MARRGAKKKTTRRRSESQTIRSPYQNPRRAARRDWRIGVDPLLEEIAGQQNAAQDLYEENRGAYKNIAQGFDTEMGNIMQGRGTRFENRMGDLTDAARNIAGAFGQFGTAGEGEDAASRRLQSTIGTNAAAALTGSFNRATNYLDKTRAQGAVDVSTARRNNLEGYRDAISKLQESRMNVFEDTAAEVRSLIEKYRQQNFENELALKEVNSNEELREYLLGYLDKGQWGGGRDKDDRQNRKGRRGRTYGGQKPEPGTDYQGSGSDKDLAHRDPAGGTEPLKGGDGAGKTALKRLKKRYPYRTIERRDGRVGYEEFQADGSVRFVDITDEFRRIRKRIRKRRKD